MRCIKNWYISFSVIPFVSLLMSSPRVTVAGGVQDQAVVALSRGKLRSSSQVLPTILISSQCLIGPVPSPERSPTASVTFTSSQTDVCVHEGLGAARGGFGIDR